MPQITSLRHNIGGTVNNQHHQLTNITISPNNQQQKNEKSQILSHILS